MAGYVGLNVRKDSFQKNSRRIAQMRPNCLVTLGPGNGKKSSGIPLEGKMKEKNRFTQSVLSASQKETVELPWTRGARRKAFIIKRESHLKALRRSA